MPSLPDVVEALVRRLDDEEPSVVEAAAEALERIGDGAIPKLVEALSSAPSLQREAIFRVLSELQMPETQILGPVRKELEAAYRLVAEKAALAGSEESPAAGYLQEALGTEVDARVRNIFRLFKAAGLRREIELVERALASEDRRAVAVAVEGLEKVVHKELRRLLIPLIEDVPLEEKLAVAARALGVSPPPLEELLGRYLDSGDRVRQIGACEMLRETGEAHRWSEPLERLLGEAPPEVASHIGPPAAADKGDSEVLTTLEKVLFLRKVDLFQSLDVRTLTAIASIAEERKLEEGEVLCREGERGDSMFCITEGAVRVLKERPDGTSLELATVGPPEVLGEMALFEHKPRSATLQAARPTTVLVIGRPAFQDIMHDYPKVGASASRMLSRRLREAGSRDSLLVGAGAFEERRARPRLDAELSAVLEGDRRVSLRNLSAGGAYLVGDRSLEPGRRVSLALELEGLGSIELEGTVRRSELAPEGEGFGVAVAFEGLDEDVARALGRWLEERPEREA